MTTNNFERYHIRIMKQILGTEHFVPKKNIFGNDKFSWFDRCCGKRTQMMKKVADFECEVAGCTFRQEQVIEGDVRLCTVCGHYEVIDHSSYDCY